MKILYITTIGSTMNFFTKLISKLVKKGNKVDIATNTSIADVNDTYRKLKCNIFNISCSRNPIKFNNIKAIYELKRIIDNGDYDIVHCHTPIASFCARLACKEFRKKGGKLVYTCHGFHFHKKSGLLSWVIYYPIEKYLSRFTDAIITINQEDFNILSNFNMKYKYFTHGVGIDTKYIKNIKVNINKFRKNLNVPKDAFLITSIGELNKNKNFISVIKALNIINDRNIYYVICGDGPSKSDLNELINNLNLSYNVKLLGKKDHDFVLKLCKCSNVGIIPSFREGLCTVGLEHMAANKPVIGSNIRGIYDYIENNVNGLLFNPNDIDDIANCILKMKNLSSMYSKMCKYSLFTSKTFDFNVCYNEILNIYNKLYIL